MSTEESAAVAEFVVRSERNDRLAYTGVHTKSEAKSLAGDFDDVYVSHAPSEGAVQQAELLERARTLVALEGGMSRSEVEDVLAYLRVVEVHLVQSATAAERARHEAAREADEAFAGLFERALGADRTIAGELRRAGLDTAAEVADFPRAWGRWPHQYDDDELQRMGLAVYAGYVVELERVVARLTG